MGTDRSLAVCLLLLVFVVITRLIIASRSRKPTLCESFVSDASRVFYVDADHGSDVNAGGKTSPVKTVNKAISLVRDPNTTIYLAPGLYTPFQLANMTSLKISGVYRQSVITNFVFINPQFIKPVFFAPSGVNVQSFIIPETIDIGGESLMRGYNFPEQSGTPLPELFINGARIPFARWPVDGTVGIAKNPDSSYMILNPGSKCSKPTYKEGGGRYILDMEGRTMDFSRWTDVTDIYVPGVKAQNWVWNMNRLRSIMKEGTKWVVTLDSCEGNTLGIEAKDWQFFENVRYELKTPGYCYIDRATRTCYFIPPRPLTATDTVALNCISGPLVEAVNCNDLVLENLVVSGSRGNGVVWSKCSNSRFTDSVVSDVIGHGIDVVGCRKCTFEDLRVEDTGLSGMRLNARLFVNGAIKNTAIADPDVYKMIRQDNLVQRCLFSRLCYYSFSEWAFVLDGCGNTVRESMFKNFPYGGIYQIGALSIIEKCDLSYGVQWTYDMGMIYAYTGMNILARGNIIRGCYFHDMTGNAHANRSGSAYALYLDDGSSGYLVENNYFCRILSAAIYVHGGNHVTLKNNVFVDCSAGVYATTNNYNRTDSMFAAVSRQWALDLAKADVTLWLRSFPEYKELFDDVVIGAEGRVFLTNVLERVRTGYKNLSTGNQFYNVGGSNYLKQLTTTYVEVPDPKSKPELEGKFTPLTTTWPDSVAVLNPSRPRAVKVGAGTSCLGPSGSSINTQPCSPSSYFMWFAYPSGEGALAPYASGSPKNCLTADGSRLYLSPCVPQLASQKFRYDPLKKSLQHVNLARCVTVHDGGNAILSTCAPDSTNQVIILD